MELENVGKRLRECKDNSYDLLSFLANVSKEFKKGELDMMGLYLLGFFFEIEELIRAKEMEDVGR